MARFAGEVGYADRVETAPGVWSEQFTERRYYGDVTRNAQSYEVGTDVNSHVRSTNAISILADAYAYDNFSAIRYVKWMGAVWTVNSVEVDRPRLILRLGGVWNGNTA